ncbi:MAG: 6,7-dimethyl-8-ribityllumazine synthase [Gammaproteobacteria bacterium]
MSEYQVITGKEKLDDARIGIVASLYNAKVVDRLLSACIARLKRAGLGAEQILVVEVPGAFEIPVAVQRLILKNACDAVIALGAVIRGETSHFDYIAGECARGLARIALDQDVPVIFGVLTVDTMEQALDRSGVEESNKGAEAAQTAIHMVHVMRQIK